MFYRTNAQSRVFEEMFIRFGTPYKVVGGVRFYERREVRDALAYLRAVANEDDTVSIRRVLNTPKRGIGDRAEACVEALAAKEGISFGAALRRAGEAPGINTRSANAIADFATMLDEIRLLAVGGLPEEVLEAVLVRSGYLTTLEESGDPQDVGRVENLQELVSVAREYTERTEAIAAAAEVDQDDEDEVDGEGEPLEAPKPTLAGFLEQVSLVADADELPTDDPEHTGVVTLMTLHTAKGLEFPVVFLTGLEDGVFPHQRAMTEPKELEEERRLAYVGITRARRRLYLSRAVTRSAWGQPQYNLGVAVPRRAAQGTGALGAHRHGLHELVRRAVGWAAARPRPGAPRRSSAAHPRPTSWPRGLASTRQSWRPRASSRWSRPAWPSATGSTTSATGSAGCWRWRGTARAPRPRSTSAIR